MTLIESVHSSRDFVSAYDRLAPVYDAFTGIGDYAAWTRGLLGEVARHGGATGGAALEIGCGTGRTTEALLHAGFRVEACDPCDAMLDHARLRLGARVDIVRGGLPDLPAGPAADLVMALNDILNYVAHEDLAPAIAAMARRAAPGGVLLFDVNTAWTYEQGFFATTFVRRAGGHVFVSEPVPGTEPGVHVADLHIFTPREHDPATCDYAVSSHRHFHHPHAAVLRALRDAGLEPLATLGQHDDGTRDPHFDEGLHLKRMYLARRP